MYCEIRNGLQYLLSHDLKIIYSLEIKKRVEVIYLRKEKKKVEQIDKRKIKKKYIKLMLSLVENFIQLLLQIRIIVYLHRFYKS